MSTSNGAKGTLETATTPARVRRDPERPRERLFQHGAQALTGAELLALCFGSGRRGEDAVELAARLLGEFDGLDGLLAAPLEKLLAARGLGPARAALLKSVHELRTRHAEVPLKRQQGFSDAATVGRYVQKRIGHREREVFGCLFLDSRHCLLRWEELFFGSVNRAHVHSREVLKRAIELNAAAVILAHNHPSGSAEPSSADIRLTAELKDLLHRVDVAVLDHIVVARQATVSLASRGLLHAEDVNGRAPG